MGRGRNKPRVKNLEPCRVVDGSAEMILREVHTHSAAEPQGKTEPVSLYDVLVIHPSLRRRAGPSIESEVLGLITDKGRYSIYAEVGEWGKLKDNSWIMLRFTTKIK